MNEAKNDKIEDLPKGWSWKRIGDIINVKSSKRIFASDYQASGIPFFRSKEVGELATNIEVKTELFIGKDKYNEIVKKYGVPKCGDMLLTSVGTIGKTWIVDDRKFYYKDGNLTLLESNNSTSMKFIQYYFQSPLFKEAIAGGITGTAYNALPIEKINNLQVPLPPLLEQQLIAQRLDVVFANIDKAIQLVQENLEHINHLLLAALNDVFENLSSITTSYRFDEFLKLSRGHNPPKSDFVYKPKDGYIRFIQIRDGSSDLNAVFVPFTNKLKLVTKEDLLIVAYRQVGKVFRGIEGAFNVALCKVTNKDKSRIDTDYIYYLIQSDFVKGELLKRSERALIPSMSVDHLAELQVPIPDLVTQQKTVQYLETLSTQQQQLQQQYSRKLQQLKSLKASLLNAAFRGELTQQATKAKVIQLPPEKLSVVAEDEAVYQTSAPLNIPQEKRAFAKQVLAGKIISLFKDDTNFTPIKFQKLQYLAEHIAQADLNWNYYYQSAGPYDNKFMHSIDTKLEKSNWFTVKGKKYNELPKSTEIDNYYKTYFNSVTSKLEKLFTHFHKASEAQTEIVATLYAVWNNLLIQKQQVTDELIVEKFYQWSDRKGQYKQEQLLSALKWMRENEIVPVGFGKEIKKKKK